MAVRARRLGPVLDVEAATGQDMGQEGKWRVNIDYDDEDPRDVLEAAKTGPAGLSSMPARVGRWVQRHWMLVVLLSAGAVFIGLGALAVVGNAHKGPLVLSEEDAAVLSGRTFLFAMNAYNSESALAVAVPQLIRLSRALGPERIAFSIYESGSSDRTIPLLQVLRRQMQLLGSVVHLVTDSTKGWKHLCPEAGVNCQSETCEQLRLCDASIRIPVMAAVRNRALIPLYEGQFDPAFTDNMLVVFLNDILFSAEDVVRLLVTEGAKYDMACAMDYEGLQLYDTWVARDLNGRTLSPWYPFIHEPNGRAAMRNGDPVRVYSCWNGMVAMRAAAFVKHNMRFRSWRDGEPTSPALTPSTEKFSKDCSVSECQLICKDFWSAGMNRIVINPRVWVVYNVKSFYIQKLLMPLLNTFWFSWTNWADANAPPAAATIADPVATPTSVVCGR